MGIKRNEGYTEMKRIEYRDIIDKSKYIKKAYSPWLSEPDEVQFEDPETGVPCIIVRNDLGVLCGYVGVISSHPYFEKDYSEIDSDIHVHGGLTYSGKLKPSSKRKSIFLQENGEIENIWLFGFDCAHLGDLCPAYQSIFGDSCDIYRTIEYVESEIKNLARQLYSGDI